MDELTEQIRAELRQIEPIISELLGLESQWSGIVELTDETTAYGRKRFGCEIDIGRETAKSPLRWRTLIHELIHAHSVGLDRGSMLQFAGWEEGPVELLQRQLRPTVLSRLGIVVSEEAFREAERQHRYNPYLVEIQRLQTLLNRPETVAFCRELLAQPLGARSEYVRDKRNEFPASAQNAFLLVFVSVNRRLCDRII